MQILNSLLVLSAGLVSLAKADDSENSIVGTWSSKSNTVFTGPGFFDPVDELLIEPSLPGISYSFTEDGHFEEALYRITSNPKNHSCPSAVLIYQHGTYETLDNGTIVLTPIDIDGRQLLSQPCKDGGASTYSRYSQKTTFLNHAVIVDDYHGRYRLNLYEWDGTPVQPLYLAYRPPLMLPTETLNPTDNSDTRPTGQSLKRRVRRSLENKNRTKAIRKSTFDHDFWWYASIGLVSVGSLGYFFM